MSKYTYVLKSKSHQNKKNRLLIVIVSYILSFYKKEIIDKLRFRINNLNLCI